MSLENLKDLLEQELKDIYNGETQIIKALPKMARAAQDPDLKQAFEDHLEETKVQKQRIEQIFEMLGMPVKGKTCAGMKGIIEEGDEVLDEAGESVMDAALIGAAQRVEHYEIAAYGSAIAMAEQLGEQRIIKLLRQTLDEESAADEKLTGISTDEVLPATDRVGENAMESESAKTKGRVSTRR